MRTMAHLSDSTLFIKLNRYVLTKEQQDFNGYPKQHPFETGRAIFKAVNQLRIERKRFLSADERLCDRCATVYRVNQQGLAVSAVGRCSYHNKQAYPRPGSVKRHSCCERPIGSSGCCEAGSHVSRMPSEETSKTGFVTTPPTTSTSCDGNYGIYALDCEMCYTTVGLELIRVTVVSTSSQIVYESFVKPDNPIVDYNTRFSGVDERDLLFVSKNLRDVQCDLLKIFNNRTILIGHSLDNDLRVLRMIHNTVIDTSLVFPHTQGPPYKKALRTLCFEKLRKTIQKDNGGHDSAEDAVACMELMIWKVKLDLQQ